MRINIYITTIVLLTVNTLWAQRNENIGTEVVNVVKPYSATISDAFKVKETPSLDDDDTAQKETITYNIFSFPVASTFTPSKGKAAAVDKSKKESLFNNYATLGFGNYGTAVAELFITENLSRNNYVGGMLRHHSSQGGIDEVLLDDKFYNTSLDLTYGNQDQNIAWNVDLGYQHQIYNWYGLPEGFGGSLDPNDFQTLINSIDPAQTFHNFYLAGKLTLEDSFFEKAALKYNRFWDAYGSAENRFFIKPSFELDFNETKIKTNVILDYIGGDFDRNYETSDAITYGYTNFGINPSVNYQQDDLSVDVGATIFYSIASEGDNKLFVYPQITASYKVVGDLMIFYAGAEGTLEQNSYRDFTNINPFLSPTLGIAPTDRQYDIFAGLKGKLAGNVSYNIRGSYRNEKNSPLMANNGFDPSAMAPYENYQYGNSMTVLYDDVKTARFFGELKADFTKAVSFGIQGTFSSYNVSNQPEAWNLPAIQLGSSLDVILSPKWYAGAQVFFVGERKDRMMVEDENAIFPPTYSFQTQTLKSFFDANAHVGYKYNERLTAFVRANNIANQAYQRWINFPVQQFQLMLGANYKFDF